MGFLSNWFGSSSADTAPAQPEAHQRRSIENKPNVWRSVFDPGSNPNTKNLGASYYDTVKDKSKEPTTWDMVLQGEQRRKSFSDLDANQDGFITRSDLQQAVGGKLDIAHIFEEADINRDGKIDRSEFKAVLEKYFDARHT